MLVEGLFVRRLLLDFSLSFFFWSYCIKRIMMFSFFFSTLVYIIYLFIVQVFKCRATHSVTTYHTLRSIQPSQHLSAVTYELPARPIRAAWTYHPNVRIAGT